jgi:hypothetical protein
MNYGWYAHSYKLTNNYYHIEYLNCPLQFKQAQKLMQFHIANTMILKKVEKLTTQQQIKDKR